ncbi:unnamed protein product [Diabrotica balteata]|uniref:Uncharacterized protein n=1 Tax=Diabrotica balteata TaxID=107213 RepID=A0A9N9X9N8_DIABA|nr:unnamed protein product [Diabrotica balteata]
MNSIPDLVTSAKLKRLLSFYLIQNLSQTIEQHFSESRRETELEIVTLQNDLCLKSVAGKEHFWCLVSKQKYPILGNVTLKISALN